MRRRSYLIDSRKLVLTGREAHQHACGLVGPEPHWCKCTLTPLDSPNCAKCRRDAFNKFRGKVPA